MGGDCLNTGCVPSKALLAAAALAHSRGQGAALGVRPAPAEVDFAAVMTHVRDTIAAIAPHDSQERFEGLGVEVIREFGRFTAPDELRAGETVIIARRFVIATGAGPRVPDIPGLADVPFLTNETLFDLRELPEHLIVIGAGAVGLEMAQAFRRLGAKVTVIEAAAVLGAEDPELVAPLVERLRGEGIDLHDSTRISRVMAESLGVAVETSAGKIGGTHLLVATGRHARTEGLGLAEAGVDHDTRGIKVDARLRSSNRRVYAIGDVAGGPQYTHAAGYQAGIVARSILFGLPARARPDIIPRAVFTDPELAAIGLSEAEARARHGDRLEVIRVPFDGNDRAVALGGSAGQLKLMAVRGRPVGVAILGPDAGELIAPWALMMANGIRLKAFAGTVLPYPTLSEIGKRAAGAYFSTRLFDNPWVKKTVGIIQRYLP